MPGNRGGGRSGGPATREVQVSKKLSWLLRHGAEKEGLQLDSKGYLNVQDVLNNRNLRSLKVTLPELKEIVTTNAKQRFHLALAESRSGKKDSGDGDKASAIDALSAISTMPEDYLIRANQGHSLTSVSASDLLEPITLEAGNLPQQAIHGTTRAAWPLIVASGGLKTMGRNHIHFAAGLPAGFASSSAVASANGIADADTGELSKTEADTSAVISGLRNTSSILIYLDVAKTLGAGVKLWRSANGVILSEGNVEGIVSVDLFARVEERGAQALLVENGKVVRDAPAAWSKKR